MYPENCSDTVHETMLIFTLSIKHFEKGEFVNCQLNKQEQEWAGKQERTAYIGTAAPKRGSVLAPYLSTPKAR